MQDPFLGPMRGGGPGYQPHVVHYGEKRRARITFSRTELQHLGAALVALTAAFFFFLSASGRWGLGTAPWQDVLVISFVAVGTGFVLHELGHKVVAQRYGLWAEFRASPVGLLLSIAVAAFFKMILAAPGAVYISGYVKTNENGRISLTGPLINLVIALLVFPFTTVVGASETFFGQMALAVFWVNGFLALFNLLPFGPLDGRKVWDWHKPLYLLSMGLAIGTVIWPSVADRVL